MSEHEWPSGSAPFSVSASVSFYRDAAGELHASSGIDVQSVVCTPGRKSGRVDVCLHGDPALALDLLNHLLRTSEPLVERGGQQVGVGHDSANRGVVLASEPSDTGSSDGELVQGCPRE